MNNIISYILIIFCLIQVSCSGDKNDSNALSVEDQAILEVLIDMHAVEASVRRFESDQKDSMVQQFQNQVFRIQKMEQSYFDSIMNIISNDQDRYKKLYAAMADTIEHRIKIAKEID